MVIKVLKNFPSDMLSEIMMVETTDEPQVKIPLFETGVPAGPFSPADGYIEKSLSAESLLFRHKLASFFVRVRDDGDSMINAKIFPGDILVVDSAESYDTGKVVCAYLTGYGVTIKRMDVSHGKCWLLPENPKYEPILVPEHEELKILGIPIKRVGDIR